MTDSIFEADELEADKVGPEGEADQKPDGQPRGPDGKFASKGADEPEPGEAQPQPGGDDADKGDDGKGGTVPQGALHAERERRKVAEAELTKAREVLAQIQKFREAAANKQPDPLPTADDPARLDHLTKRIEELGQAQHRTQRERELEAADLAEVQHLGTLMASSEAAYRESKPDYDAAIGHVVQARAQELQLYGFTPAQIQQAIAEEATDIVRSAVAQGRDPAELGYQIAVSRGYRPDAAQQSANGSAAATIEAIAKAQGQSRSLSQAAGATPQAINLEAIAAMSPEEFDALYSTPEGRKLVDNL